MMNVAGAPAHCSQCHQMVPSDSAYCPRCGAPIAASDPMLGVVLGDRFVLRAILGHGATGTVYAAEHNTLRRQVAVKILSHDMSRDDLALERFRREATSVAALNNPHVTQILDFGRTLDGKLYFAMEYLDGETVRTRVVREQQLDTATTVNVLRQTAEALIEAHANGFVHRNLTARNVFLTLVRGETFVKLLDFGLAKLIDSDAHAASTSVGMTYGDPHYMSPEQARGERIDQRADLYQLGCLGFEMLTGRTPFGGGNTFDILSRHVAEAPPPVASLRPDVPAYLAGIIDGLLAKRPDERPASAAALADMLRTQSAPKKSRGSAVPTLLDGSLSAPTATTSGRIVIAPRDDRAPAPAAPVSVAPPKPITLAPPAVAALPTPIRNQLHARNRTDSGAWYQEDASGGLRAAESSDIFLAARRSKRRRNIALGAVATAMLAASAWGLTQLGSSEPTPNRAEAVAPANSATQPAPPNQPAPPPLAPAAPVTPAPTTIEPVPTPAAVVTPPNSVASRPTIVTPPDRGGRAPKSGPALSAEELAASMLGHTRSSPVTPAPSPAPSSAPSVSPPTTPSPAITQAPSAAGTAPIDPYATSTQDGLVDPYDSATPAAPSPSPTAPPSPATSDNNVDAAALVRTGTAALRAGQLDQASTAFSQALAAEPGNGGARAGLGEVALKQGQVDEAIRHLRRASQTLRSSHVHTLWGEALVRQGDRASAATQFKEALRIDPDNARARAGFLSVTAE